MSAVGSDAAVGAILSQHLTCFHGIVAVGTACGHIYLLGVNFSLEYSHVIVCRFAVMSGISVARSA